MRRKFDRLRLFTAVLCGLIALAAFGASSRASEGATGNPPIIPSASEVDYPPFCAVDADGRATGFSVELMRAALKAMGREVTFRTGPWDDVKGWLERGEVQALPLVGRTPEREAVFDFTVPYMTLHGAIVVREGTADIQTLGDLRGRRVAVMKGDNAEEFLRREDRGIDIRTTLTFENALRELSEGRHDAVVIQRLVALRLLQETGLRNLKIVNTPVEGFRQDFCFAVREGDRETLALLNEGLALVTADGTYRHLHAKWFAALELPTHRRIVIGGDANYPPFEYLDANGRPAGYNVDLTRAIAREVGLDIEIRLGPWSDIIKGLETGEIDAIQGMFYSPERDLKFDFSAPHAVNHCVSVIRKGEGSPPAGPADLAGKRIAVQRGDIMHDWALQNGLKDRVTAFDAQEDALREVAQGRYDCALVSRLTALYWIKEYGWDNLDVGRRPLLSPGYCYVALNNRQALLAEFGEGLKVLEKTGEYRRIQEKWMGVYEDPGTRIETILRHAAMGAIPVFCLLLAIFLWSWSLRGQVARRTAALRESERRLATLMGNLPGMAYRCANTPDWAMEFVSEGCLELTGYNAEDLTAGAVVSYERIIHPEDRRLVWEGIASAVAAGSPFTLEYRIVSKNGELKWVWEKGRAVSSGPGRELMLEGFITDITGFKHARERIEHLNNVLRAIRDINQLIVHERNREALIREGCRLLVANRGYATALIVLTDENNRPVTWAEAGLGSDFDRMAQALERGELPICCDGVQADGNFIVVANRASSCAACPLALNYPDKDALCVGLVHGGRSFGYLTVSMDVGRSSDIEEQSLFSEMAGDLSYALHVLRMDDIRQASEKKSTSLENQLHQARKMESIGRLAGGVAHDFNNMLNVIIGYADLAMDKMSPADPLYANFKEIHSAAERSAGITRQLLAFARRQTIAPKVLDLNETLESMFKMLRRLIGEDLDLAWLPGKHLWPVSIDPAQVDQILANLCVNARDAISGTGKITIETDNVVLDEAYSAAHAGFAPGEYVMLAVSDDGRGMDQETIDNIFEPFFTTKPLGQGTGLGLATVFGIVKQNGGNINVYSEPGRGTTFKLYFPRHRREPLAARGEEAAGVPRSRGETILLVEDEPAILQVAESMLRRLGYEVLSASTPDQALRLAQEKAGGIHLLVTDVVMPEMNGRSLANRLLELDPNIKTLFMSGYTANVIAHRGVLDEGVNFIQKPFSMKDLAGKVRETLDRQ